MLEICVNRISAQQEAVGRRGPVYWCGEQLKDICRATAGAAELVAADVGQPGMGIADCEKKIREHFQKNRPGEADGAEAADKIIREFYGLPEAGAAPVPRPQLKPVSTGMKLTDFLK